ncbi:hypothetical protein C5E45_07430 [Nocardia nova]|uniref:Uncharacterized protein n=1 Tax=Nocardia nova TaxID=37330 RepID=A0A2S6ATW3_9NOCA|nr:hypothetical protein [Nocardia nova]PPJ30927.1 hypothetical protein C5E41_08910 [Nocardia nova]PPJ38717.1 hypothetical protein C5E45_07430 [Nocardia nova]
MPPIGDITTVDPCGFIAPDAFADLKTVETAITVEPSNFVKCNLSLPLAGNDSGRIAVWTTLGAHTADLASSDAVSTVRGPIRVTTGTSRNGTRCDATARLDNGQGILLHAEAERYDKRPADVDPCPARDRAIESIVTTMKNGMYTRIAYPSDSLHGYNLCGSISLPEVESAVNLTGLADKSAPAEQDCQWRTDGASDMSPGAMVSVMLDDPKIFLGERSAINGFPARVWDISQSGGPGRCVVTTTTKRWNPWPGQHHSNATAFAELLYTQVILPDQTEPGQACRAATAVTTQVLSHRAPN